MVNGWRRAFCTSIPKDSEPKLPTDINNTNPTTPKLGFTSKFTFFSSSSNPSTPRPQKSLSPPVSSTIRCRTAPTSTATTPTCESPRLQCSSSSSSSSRAQSSSTPSPSTLSLLLKASLRLTKSVRCGICMQNVKSGQGMAIFTAECSHSFHFPCIASLAAQNNGVLLSCPLCGAPWKEAPILGVPKLNHHHHNQDNDTIVKKNPVIELRMYDDDEPLMSPVSGIRFNPIPETDEESEESEADCEFPGFFSDPATPRSNFFTDRKIIDVAISPEAAVVAVGRSYETYAVLLTIRAPAALAGSRRRSVDLVTVIDVGGEMTSTKLHALKKAMIVLISSLSSNDRLSIVAFSANSKRLIPLRRMTPSGRRSARRLVATLSIGQGSCLNDALRKGAKVLQDRKEKNHFSTIILMDGRDGGSEARFNLGRRFDHVSSTRFSHLEIPVHTFKVGEELYEEVLMKSVNKFLSVVVFDVRVQFGLGSGSAAAQIAAVYSCTGRPGLLNYGSAKLGDLYSEEVREILVELKVPASAIGSHHFLSVRSYFKDPSSSMKQVIYGGDKSLLIPRPHTIRSSDPSIQRLRSLFVMTRAVAESRRLLTDRNDLAGAERLLISARAVLSQPSLKVQTIEEYKKRVEAELAEVRWRRKAELEEKQRREKDNGTAFMSPGCLVDEKGEPLTPTSAWKAAERLAKVAMMRKSMNRVSDLHGLEDARF